MAGKEFIKSATYFDLLLEVIDYAEEILGVRSLHAVYSYLLGYEFAMARSGAVELGPDRLVPILEEIVRPEGISFMKWPAVLIRRCGSEEAAYARFRELIAEVAEKEKNE